MKGFENSKLFRLVPLILDENHADAQEDSWGTANNKGHPPTETEDVQERNVISDCKTKAVTKHHTQREDSIGQASPFSLEEVAYHRGRYGSASRFPGFEKGNLDDQALSRTLTQQPQASSRRPDASTPWLRS